MPKRSFWDFELVSPLKTVPAWLRGDNVPDDRPQLCMFDMLLILGEVQRVTGYTVSWEWCHEGGFTLDGETAQYTQQNVKGGGYPYRSTLRFTRPELRETQLQQCQVGKALMNALHALNSSSPPNRVQGDGLWLGAGLDLTKSEWKNLFEGDQFTRHWCMIHGTVAELEDAFALPFPLGFKVGLDYGWTQESFGVFHAAIKRRLRAARST